MTALEQLFFKNYEMTTVYYSLQYTEYTLVRVYSENQEFRISIVCFDLCRRNMFLKRHKVSDNLSAGKMFAFYVTKEGDSEYLKSS